MTLPQDMMAIAIARPGDPEVLEPVRLPVPVPGAGEVLIRVAAAGVNYPDVMQRLGRYDPPPGHSPIPGLEVSGEIAALGEGVFNFTLGDRVLALCNGGGYAEYVVVPMGQVLPLPHEVDLVHAASLPETFFTIEQTLVMRAGLQPGMTVLIHGAAGGIGGAAIGIGKALGARPIAVVSDAEKVDYVKKLGAAEAIIHTEEDFVERVQTITEGRGADRIISIAGGDMLARNLKAAARGAVIIQLAALGSGEASIPIWPLLGKGLTLIGSTLRAQPNEVKEAIAESLREKIWPAFAAGAIVLPQLRILPMREAHKAHSAMESRGNFGKHVLLTPYGEDVGDDNSIAPF